MRDQTREEGIPEHHAPRSCDPGYVLSAVQAAEPPDGVSRVVAGKQAGPSGALQDMCG